MKHKGMLMLMALGLALALFGALPTARVSAATCTSTGNGNWSVAGTWTDCGGGIPQTGDSVVIAASHTVTVDTNTNSLSSLTVNGTGILSCRRLGSPGKRSLPTLQRTPGEPNSVRF